MCDIEVGRVEDHSDKQATTQYHLTTATAILSVFRLAESRIKTF
jgi:hypothetical protein